MTTQTVPQFKSNGISMFARFASTCPACDQPIAKGDAILYFPERAKDKAEHKICPAGTIAGVAANITKYAPTPAPVAAPATRQPSKSKLHDGYYTVVFTWQNQPVHRTLRLHTPKDGGFAGRQIVALLTGSDNTSDYTSFGCNYGGGISVWKGREHQFQSGIAAINLLNEMDESLQHKAGEAYALESGRCWVCGRMLTNDKSIVNGIGPDCAKRF